MNEKSEMKNRKIVCIEARHGKARQGNANVDWMGIQNIYVYMNVHIPTYIYT